MTEPSWSQCGGQDCLRIPGVGAGALVQVRVVGAEPDAPRRRLDGAPLEGRAGPPVAVGGLPPMAGRLVLDGDDLCFVPRFAFVPGTVYAVLVEGLETATLARPRTERVATTEVLEIRPTAREVPRNLLRLYVRFSAAMSEGWAARHVRLVDDAGDVLTGALLPTEYELWDADRRRLTVLLDPSRIKRGLAPHRQAGYPLRAGTPFRVAVGDGFRDAAGARLRAGAARDYQVGGDERRRIEPEGWALTVPSSDSREPVGVDFGRPLDHALIGRCLRVVGPDGRLVEGRAEAGPEERSWRLAPVAPWAPGPHRLVVDPDLEDLAGNSVRRVFDRDLARAEDNPREKGPVVVTFHPR